MRIKPILFISPLPPPQGGIATWTQKIVRYGLPYGHPFRLINTKIRGRRNIFTAARLSLAEIWRTLSILLGLIANLFFKRPKLIHINCALSPSGIIRDYLCACFAKVFRIPFIMHFHGNMADFEYEAFYGLSGKALRFLMKNAFTNIVINQASLLSAPIKKHIVLLPNFIEDHIFSMHSIERQPPHLNFSAVFVGGITQKKGCQEIVLAAKAHPTLAFHFYGAMHEDMADTVLPTNVIVHGETEHEMLLSCMSQHDFLILPSYSEGFPLSVLEAMALGLPVIATEVGAIPQMIEPEKGGYLIPPKDPQALITAIAKLLSEKDQLKLMGAYNRNKAFQEYRYSKVIKDLMHIYNQVDKVGKALCAE